jgi:DNA invertase Pin-like site-specific DNA recombinase/predicted metal-binding protein
MKTNNQEVKYIAYSRKSTESEERQVLSLNDQKRELEEMQAKEKLYVTEKYLGDKIGESQSAYKRGRPIFGHMMEQIETGKANGLLVWHPNRLARNAFDGGWIITAMDEGKLLEIRTPQKTYRHDNSDDKFFLSLEFGVAKKSSDDNSTAVKRGLKTKLAMGWYPSRAPLGYLNTKNPDIKGSNEIITDPERFEIVKQMWQLMLTGNYSVMEILHKANKEWKLKTRPTKKYPGLKPLSRTAIYEIFTNPFYYGYFAYGKGADRQLYPGKHEPMITAEEFDRVQLLLGRKGRPRPKEHRFEFTGLMRCGHCGAMITAEEKIKHQKNGNIHHYVYYRCTKRKDPHCPEKTIELKEFNRQVDEVIAGINISEKFKGWAIKYLHEIRKDEAASQDVVLANKQKQLRAVVSQLESLLLRYTAPENANGTFISSEEYQSAKSGLVRQKAELENDLAAHGKKIEEWVELSERTFNFVRYARVWFAKGDLEARRAIFACLGSHLVLSGQKVAINLHPVFQTIVDNLPQAEKELGEVRTSLSGENKRKTAEVSAVYPSVRCVLNKVRMYFESNPDVD